DDDATVASDSDVDTDADVDADADMDTDDDGQRAADAGAAPPEPPTRRARHTAPLPDGSTPLPTGRRPGFEAVAADDDEVDLAALVAEVDAGADDEVRDTGDDTG